MGMHKIKILLLSLLVVLGLACSVGCTERIKTDGGSELTDSAIRLPADPKILVLDFAEAFFAKSDLEEARKYVDSSLFMSLDSLKVLYQDSPKSPPQFQIDEIGELEAGWQIKASVHGKEPADPVLADLQIFIDKNKGGRITQLTAAVKMQDGQVISL